MTRERKIIVLAHAIGHITAMNITRQLSAMEEDTLAGLREMLVEVTDNKEKENADR